MNTRRATDSLSLPREHDSLSVPHTLAMDGFVAATMGRMPPEGAPVEFLAGHTEGLRHRLHKARNAIAELA